MSGIELVPEHGGDAIQVSNNKTTIGRGPFMKIIDKRVSRNHANLEINDKGKLVVTPIHTNPCFVKPNKSGEKLTLPKDKAHVLEHGDVLGLLPDSLFYKVIYEDNNTSNKQNAVKKEIKPIVIKPLTESEVEELEDRRKMNGKTAASINKTVKTGRKEIALPLDKQRTLPKWMLGAAKRVAVTPPKKESQSSPSKPRIAENAKQPIRKKQREPESESEDEEPPPKPTPKKGGRGVPKRKVVEDEDEDWDVEEVKPQRKPGRGRRKRHDSEEEENEEEEDEEEMMEPNAKRQRRASSQKQAAYADDLCFNDYEWDLSESEEEAPKRRSSHKDDDSDFVADEPAESGSDWELQETGGSRKGRRKGRRRGTPSTPRRGPRGRRSRSTRKKRRNNDDSDDFSDDDEAYVPRLSNRRAATSRSKRQDSDDESEVSEAEVKPQPKKRAATSRSKRQDCDDESEVSEAEVKPQPTKRAATAGSKRQDSDDEEEISEPEVKPQPKKRKTTKAVTPPVSEDEEQEEQPKPRSKRKKGAKNDVEEEKPILKTKMVSVLSSEEEESEQEERKPKPKKKKRRKSCWFGKKCYRKNPSHFVDFCHPGDDTYDEDEAEDQNPGQHPGRPKRPAREKDLKSVLHGASDDDGGANTYDYNDSFLAKESVGSDGSSSYLDPAEEDSDWAPDDSENIRQVVKEAKKFVKSKKMAQPSRRK